MLWIALAYTEGRAPTSLLARCASDGCASTSLLGSAIERLAFPSREWVRAGAATVDQVEARGGLLPPLLANSSLIREARYSKMSRSWRLTTSRCTIVPRTPSGSS